MCLLGWREATGASRPLFHSFTFLVSTPRLFPALQAMAIASQAAKGNPPPPFFRILAPGNLEGIPFPPCTRVRKHSSVAFGVSCHSLRTGA